MNIGSTILGFLLIATLVMATLASGALTAADHASGSSGGLLAAPGERPAGCHAHGGKNLSGSQLPHSSPSPPASHECCLTGHDVAVVQASHYTPPSHPWRRATLQIAPVLTECFFRGSEVSMVLSADPPGITPLRI